MRIKFKKQPNLKKIIQEELQKVLLREDQWDLDYERPGPFSGQRVFRSRNKFTGFQNKEQRNEPWMKPQGLWYSCGASWDDWCKYEMPEWVTGVPHVYEIKVNPDRMIIINNDEDFQSFEKEFSVHGGRFDNLIDWTRVAQQYDGIEICPYRDDFRYKNWYYAWDVASGCIWSEGAFVSAEEIEDPCKDWEPESYDWESEF